MIIKIQFSRKNIARKKQFINMKIKNCKKKINLSKKIIKEKMIVKTKYRLSFNFLKKHQIKYKSHNYCQVSH